MSTSYLFAGCDVTHQTPFMFNDYRLIFTASVQPADLSELSSAVDRLTYDSPAYYPFFTSSSTAGINCLSAAPR